MATDNHVVLGDDGAPIFQHTYNPNGSDHDLQQVITSLLHDTVTEHGKFTLAEMGYLHINTLTYNKERGELNLRVYFDATYAARVVENQTNRGRTILPIKELLVFQNILFVGALDQVVTFEKIMAPKSKCVEDRKGRPSIKFKDDGKLVETNVLVLNCNLAITMAAAHDINLSDPEFKVSCQTVGKGTKNKMKSIIATGNMTEVPVAVTITASAGDEYVGYDPAGAVPYLTSLAKRVQQAAENRDKLSQKVRKDAKSAKKKNGKGAKKDDKNFDKYS